MAVASIPQILSRLVLFSSSPLALSSSKFHKISSIEYFRSITKRTRCTELFLRRLNLILEGEAREARSARLKDKLEGD